MRSIRRFAAAAAIAAVAASAVVFVGASASYATGSGTLTVDVTDGSTSAPSPTPSGSASAPPRSTPPGSPATPSINPGRPQTPVVAQVTQATIPNPQTADEALGDDPVSTGETITMSGLSAVAEPSFAVGNGTLTLSFVVRSTWREPMDLSARFWVDNVVGMRLADVDDVAVKELQPDETRRVQVRIDGLGQHAVLRNYVTLTPPATVGGVELEAMTRNTTIAVPPLFSMALTGGIGAAAALAWWFVAMRGWGFAFWRLGRWA